MKIKGVVFDIGQTLVYYPAPLNWSALYRPAFESAAEKNGLTITEDGYAHVARVLTKYNTRVNPRETEVPSGRIFTEILGGIGVPLGCLDAVKRDFYSFFRNEARVFDDVPGTLQALKSEGIVVGTLSDVPYGMDNSYALGDIAEVLGLIDWPLTSNDVGFRKPNRKGLELLAGKMGIRPSEMMFVGDEKKDIECALNAGAVPVLISRSGDARDFGQRYTIRRLDELLGLTG